MYTTSTAYKTEIQKRVRSFECRVTIGDRIFNNEQVQSIELNGGIQDVFSIGNTPSMCLDLVLRNTTDTIFTTNPVKVEIGLKIGANIEYVPLGIFNIHDIKKDDFTTKFTCYDNMSKFDIAYFSSLGDTHTLQQVVNELASKTGVQFTGSLPPYTVKKLEGFTCREILSYIASICGGNAVITRDGKFTIVYPSDVNRDIGEGVFDLQRDEVKYKIGKITCQNKENETISKGSLGTDSMELTFENPWVTDGVLQDIFNRLNGFEYLGYTIKCQGDLALDVGDIITYTDIKGVTRKLPIFNRKLSYDGGLDSELSAKGETKNSNSFNSSGSIANKVERTVTELALINKAYIDYTVINDANIKILKADTAKIGTLEADTANINTILAGNIGAGSTQTIHLTAKNVVMDDAVIKTLIASKISVGDLLAGNIDANRFNIVGSNGNLTIKDNTIQIKDSKRVRVQIGKDANGDYNMYQWDADGKLMFDATGLKADGIKNKIIRDDMISDTANINGKKIDISSLVTEVNKDTNTQLIKASKVAIDLTGQSLEVSFNSLKSNIDSKEARNLVLKSDTLYNNTNYPIVIYTLSENLVVGQTYTFLLKGTLQDETKQQFGAWQNGGSSRVGYFTKKAGLYYLTFTAVNTTAGNERKISIYAYPNTVGLLNKIEYVKLEKGVNETPYWTPAPEDIDQKIQSNTTSITAVQGKIDTLVKDTTIEKDGQQIKLKDAYTSFTQEYDTFKLNVINTYTTRTYVDGAISGLDTRLKTAELAITKDAIISTVQSTITTAKTEAITSANSNTANLLKSYSTTTQMSTAITQSANGVKTEVSNTYATINALGSTTSRVQATEQKLTAEGITTTIRDAINSGGNNKIDTTSFTMAKDGFTVKNGAIKILNKAGTEVLAGDTSGNLTMIGTLKQYGTSTGVIGSTLEGCNLHMYDWMYNGDFLGGFCSVEYDSAYTGGRRAGVQLYGDEGNPLFLGWKRHSDGRLPWYMMFDDTMVELRNIGKIKVNEHMVFTGGDLRIDNRCIDFFDTAKNANRTKGRISFSNQNDIAILRRQGPAANGGTNLCFGHMLETDENTFDYNIKITTGLTTVYGDLTVTGKKPRTVDTEYGMVAFDAYETASPYFGDIGRGIIDETGKCYVFIDPIVLDATNTKYGYEVFLQKYGDGSAYPSEFNDNYFVVEGTPGISFGWEVKIRQRDYELDRLEHLDVKKVNEGLIEDGGDEIFREELDYGDVGNYYIENYEKEIIE